MASTFTTTQTGASADYIQYLLDQAQKIDRNGSPVLLNFSLAPTDDAFVKLTRGAYIKIDTTVYPNWFTGYVTNDPELTYLGTRGGVPTWGYNYGATDDSYILSLKPIGLLPPYINSTAGQIIKSLVAILDTSELFDVTNIEDGPLIARYIVDPNKKFQDIITDLTKISAFRFVANDHKLYFEANDATDATIAINGDTVANTHFTPSSLTIRPTTDPIVNDAIVVGAPEPQNYIKEWWVGDGFTGEFPLLSGLYGGDSSLLLQDDFSGEDIDTTNWNIYDELDNLQLANGYLNVLGGNADGSFDIHLDSALVLPLESALRITHGVWDFVDTGSQPVAGIIGGIWTQAPNAAMTGCVYATNVSSDGTNLTLKPIVNGIVDTSQFFEIDFSKRYVLRTLCSFSRANRQDTTYSYLAADGTTGSYGGTGVADTVTYSFWVTEFDPVTGNITRQNQFVNADVNIDADVTFATYIPVADNDLHVTLMGITVSVPMAGALYEMPAGTYDPAAFVPKLLGPNEIDSLDGLAPAATITTSGGSVQGQTNGLGTPRFNPGDATLAFFKDSIHLISYIPNPGDIVKLAYRRAGVSVGRVQSADSITLEAAGWGDDGIRSLTRSDISPAPRTSRECELAAGAIVQDFGFQHFEGDYTQYSLFEFTGEPQSGTVLKFNNLPAQFPSYLQAEVISEVDSTLFLRSPQEFFLHKVSFGKPDNVSKAIARFYRAENQINFGLNIDAVDTPDATQLEDVGLADTDEVLGIALTGYDATNFYFNTNQAVPAGGGFEVRLTDNSWGANDAKNLVTRFTSGTTFVLPRNNRVKVGFVKAYTSGHAAMSRYAAGLRVSFPSVPSAPLGLTVDTTNLTITPTLPLIQRDIYGVEIYKVKGTGVTDSAAFTLVSDGPDTRQVDIYGLDASGAQQSEVVTLNGTTPVSPLGTYSCLAAVQMALMDTERTVTIANATPATLGTIGPGQWHAEIGVQVYTVTDILLASAEKNDAELTYTFTNDSGESLPHFAAFFFNMLGERSSPWAQPVALSAGNTECLDVRNFGAVGDGFHDDTGAVQMAIDTAHWNWLQQQLVAAGSAPSLPYIPGPTKVCISAGLICLVGKTAWITANSTGLPPANYDWTKYSFQGSASPAFGSGPITGYPNNGSLYLRGGVTLQVDGVLQGLTILPVAVPISVVSDDPTDTTRTVTIFGNTSSGFASETLTVNGTTPVLTTTAFINITGVNRSSTFPDTENFTVTVGNTVIVTLSPTLGSFGYAGPGDNFIEVAQDATDVTISGAGVIAGEGPSNVIIVANMTRFTMSGGLTIDGGSGESGIRLRGQDTITGPPYVYADTDSSIQDVTIKNCIYGLIEDWMLCGCDFTNVTCVSNRNGFVFSLINSTVTNCVAKNGGDATIFGGAGGGTAFYIFGASNSKVLGCSALYNIGVGLDVGSMEATGPDGNFETTWVDGLLIDNFVANNQIMSSFGTTSYGASFDAADALGQPIQRVTVSNLVCNNNDGPGLVIQGPLFSGVDGYVDCIFTNFTGQGNGESSNWIAGNGAFNNPCQFQIFSIPSDTIAALTGVGLSFDTPYITNMTLRNGFLQKYAAISVVNEVPTGSINGSNTTFTLANTPDDLTTTVTLQSTVSVPSTGGFSFAASRVQVEGSDYTITGAVITMTTAPPSGTKLLVSYSYQNV